MLYLKKRYRLSDSKFWVKVKSDFGNKGGVYKLYCLNKNGEIIKINRLLETDINGILYIGKATSFLDRVITLKKSISPNYISSNHECGVRYKNSDSISEKFPFDYLYIELNSSEDIHSSEIELLDEYEKRFGELPPLNRSK